MSSLKNYIDMSFLKSLSSDLSSASKKFNGKGFLNSVQPQLSKLELKERIRLVSTELGRNISAPYPQQIDILKKAAPKHRGLAGLIFPDFVEVYGQEDVTTSLEALKFFTPFSSAEFAIRPFIEKDPVRLMKVLQKWSRDSDEHIRRLSSEGSRPRLPWSFKLREFVKDPTPTLAILEQLKADESLYVRKSVANHLNDISKDHPDLALSLAKKWIGQSAHTDWILKHALRTLLKRGDQRALKLFGVAAAKNVQVAQLSVVKKKNAIGSSFEFSFIILNKTPQTLRLEYAIHYLKKNGSYSKKVFKISEKSVAKGDHKISRRHSLRQMTTRQHNAGLHKVEVIINGQTMMTTDFLVTR
ncbi:DNA alkylation repair protein [Pseudobdellovibrio exovorus]|nr:DNA alkylation repair protein [Pseudobdellovibrio exovorus]